MYEVKIVSFIVRIPSCSIILNNVKTHVDRFRLDFVQFSQLLVC